MANAVKWFEIIGKDGPQLREFYGRLFDWQFQEAPGMDYGMIHGSDGGISGGIGSGTGTGMSYVAIFIEVPDINASLEQVEKLGGKILMPRTPVSDQVIFAMFSDPEGHVIGLTEGG